MTYQSWRDSFSNRDWRKSQRQSMEKLPFFWTCKLKPRHPWGPYSPSSCGWFGKWHLNPLGQVPVHLEKAISKASQLFNLFFKHWKVPQKKWHLSWLSWIFACSTKNTTKTPQTMGPPTTAEVQHQKGHGIVVLRPGAGFGCPVSDVPTDLKYDNERKGMMMLMLMLMMMMMIMLLVFDLDLETSWKKDNQPVPVQNSRKIIKNC